MYCYIWEYHVKPERLNDFKKLYGPTGDWVALFSESEHHQRTELLDDCDHPLRFCTIDHWTSKEHCESFRQSHSGKFEAIDAVGDQLTDSEKFLGAFDY